MLSFRKNQFNLKKTKYKLRLLSDILVVNELVNEL